MERPRRTRADIRLLAFSLLLTNFSAALLSAGSYVTNTFAQMDKADQCALFLAAGITAIAALAIFLFAAHAWSFDAGRLATKTASLIASAVGAALFAGGALTQEADSMALFVAAGAVMALGCAAQFMAWGKAFARISLRYTTVHVGVSAALSALISLAILATSSAAVILSAIALLPLASAILIPDEPARRFRSDEAVENRTEEYAILAASDKSEPEPSNPTRFGLWSLLAGLFVCIAVATFMWRTPTDAAELQFAPIITQGTFFGFNVCALAWSIVAHMHPSNDFIRNAALRLCPVFASLPLIPCLIPIEPEGVIGFFMGGLTGAGFAFFATLPLSLLCKEANSSDRRHPQIVWPSAFLSSALGAAAGFAAAPFFDDSQSGFVVTALFVAYLVALAAAPKVRDKTDDADEGQPLRQLDPVDERCRLIADEYRLTPRETDVLSYLARGRSAAYAAKEMLVSTETVKVHVRHIYEKLGIHSRQELLDLVQSNRP